MRRDRYVDWYGIVSRSDHGALRLSAIGLILVVVAALASFLLKPSYKSYKDSALLLEELSGKSTNVVDFDSKYESLDGQIQNYSATIKDGVNESKLKRMESLVLANVQEIAWSYQLKVVNASSQSQVRLFDYDGLSYEFIFEGSYERMIEFITNVNNDMTYLVVEQFQLYPSRSSDYDTLTLKLKLSYIQVTGA